MTDVPTGPQDQNDARNHPLEDFAEVTTRSLTPFSSTRVNAFP